MNHELCLILNNQSAAAGITFVSSIIEQNKEVEIG